MYYPDKEAAGSRTKEGNLKTQRKKDGTLSRVQKLKKRLSLSFGRLRKKKIIEAVANGEKHKEVAARFCIAAFSITSILKKKDSLSGKSENLKSKRDRKPQYPEFEHCLLQWFTNCRSKSMPVSSHILKEKAPYFAANLHVHDFKASDGWIANFKKRNMITFKKLCGESGDVNKQIYSYWKIKLKDLVSHYEARNVFNADETSLFFQCLPDRTLCFKNEKCHGDKNSKVRATLLLCTNMDGSGKLKPLMIGKSAKPRCFKNIKSFPLYYRSNSKAWMTSVLFDEWLKIIDNDMKKLTRQIL
ncbi:hypothetical protein TKK_0016991 [Trichogramma kaykai]